MLDLMSLFDLINKLNVIQTVKDKLLAQPDPAADKLVVVFGELSKVFGVCETELLRYLNLSFDPTGDVSEERSLLLTLEGGQLWARASETRGHCHKIWNIYQKYLARWFQAKLQPDEAAEMKALFESLSYADSQMDMAITHLVDWLTDEAGQVLNLVDDGKYDEANQHIRLARKEILPTRQALSKANAKLLELQAEFIAISGIV